MSAVLVLGLANHDAIHPGSFEAAAVGKILANSLGIPLIGTLAAPTGSPVVGAFRIAGFNEVIVPSTAESLPADAESQTAWLSAVVKHTGASVILAPHCLDSAEWLPLLAAKLGGSIVTDCRAITFEGGSLIATKPICGGAVLAEFALLNEIKIATLSLGSGSADTECSATVPIDTLQFASSPSTVTVIEETTEGAESGPSLTRSRTVVAGGLGVGKRENWHLVSDTAAALEAAVGATRAVVDAGWISAKNQVGYSGSKIAPELYVAIGISGAVHHLAGIGRAKNVVAINSDPGAEIFKVARFGVVADAKVVIPAFLQRVRELRG